MMFVIHFTDYEPVIKTITEFGRMFTFILPSERDASSEIFGTAFVVLSKNPPNQFLPPGYLFAHFTSVPLVPNELRDYP
jgi:hypothetical protein